MKKVFLTGGNGDIGAEIKKEFEKNGYEVTSVSSKELDLKNRKSIDDYFENNDSNFDIVIHCAGINNPKYFKDISYEDLDEALEVNLLSFYRALHWILPSMRKNKGGHILGISSIYGTISRAKRTSYAISKHGMQALVKTLAIELGRDGILINSLSPGFIDTKLTRKNLTKKEIKELERKIPLRRLADPDEVAKIALFLCSLDNTYLTGQNIVVDGGYIIGGFQE